ncbi:serine/threonine protein phosphatase [Rubellicoccus peritrichatus]|uniref:Serine/threonine protein phosphatase n=1 Tax=Rubellicoccus peritrichatus TaxID=3080537 RepID=A0AAQ3LB30_9BACT|nr:serine/threonine protein phosphatase [Puniceicoccus sp. CR14]WOO41259.1 serine/threonine protein phosphatase [Puniceicoccus sp. CR14]
MKDSKVASVQVGYDGRVHKRYRGPLAQERYDNELRVLRYLEAKGCNFVPKILEEHPDELYLVTSNCGAKANNVGDAKMQSLFDELASYGVEHDDRAARNITYSAQIGRFCIIDFEFATIPETGEGLTLEEATKHSDALKKEGQAKLRDGKH